MQPGGGGRHGNGVGCAPAEPVTVTPAWPPGARWRQCPPPCLASHRHWQQCPPTCLASWSTPMAKPMTARADAAGLLSSWMHWKPLWPWHERTPPLTMKQSPAVSTCSCHCIMQITAEGSTMQPCINSNALCHGKCGPSAAVPLGAKLAICEEGLSAFWRQPWCGAIGRKLRYSYWPKKSLISGTRVVFIVLKLYLSQQLWPKFIHVSIRYPSGSLVHDHAT